MNKIQALAGLLCGVIVLAGGVHAADDPLNDRVDERGDNGGIDESAEVVDPAIVDPESCVQLTRIRHTDVIDDRNVIFYMHGGKIFHNRLPNRCPGLTTVFSL